MKRLLAIPAALAVVLAGQSAIARAATATYQVTACNDAPEAGNNSWAWSTNDPSTPAHYERHTTCPYRIGATGGKTDQEGGLSTTDSLGAAKGPTEGMSAGWTFTAPTGTTISTLNYDRYLGHELDAFNDWVPALRADSTIVPGESCQNTIQNGDACFVGGPPGEGGERRTITGLQAHQLSLGIECVAPSEQECVNGSNQHLAWATLYGATVTISDPNPPQLETPTGPLWQNGGYHKGTETLTVAASDVGGGIRRIAVNADGTPLAAYDAPCDFTMPQPCPHSSGEQTFNAATGQLADGPHTLTVIATDAAGNTAEAQTTINVDNEPPAAPVGLAATPTGSGSMTFVATWKDPPHPGAPIAAANYEVCGGPPISACTNSATAASPEGPLTFSVPGAGQWVLRVWLTDAAGNATPSNAASVSMLVLPPEVGESSAPPAEQPVASPSLPQVAPPALSTARPWLTLHVSRRRGLLVVHLSGTAGVVRVSYSARRRRRWITIHVRKVSLSGGVSTRLFIASANLSHDILRIIASLQDTAGATVSVRRIIRPH